MKKFQKTSKFRFPRVEKKMQMLMKSSNLTIETAYKISQMSPRYYYRVIQGKDIRVSYYLRIFYLLIEHLYENEEEKHAHYLELMLLMIEDLGEEELKSLRNSEE